MNYTPQLFPITNWMIDMWFKTVVQLWFMPYGVR